MGHLPPLTTVILGIVLVIETALLGVWWRRRHSCPWAKYLNIVVGLIIYGALAWMITRALAIWIP